MEAQAAGLPCLVSDSIPREAELVGSLVRRLSLSQGPSEWAKELLDAIVASRGLSPEEALAVVEKSRLSLSNSIRELQDAYGELSLPQQAQGALK